MRATWILILIGIGLGLAACSGPARNEYDQYQKPSPLLEKEIRDRIAALEFESGVGLMQNQQRLAYIGEPAIPYLLDALKGESPLTRGSSAYILGTIRDIRTLPALRDLAAGDPVGSVRYEAAAALIAVGDKAHGLPVLVEGLADTDLRARYKCFEVLKEQTGLAFGFEHDGEPARRARSVEQWRAWVAKTYPETN